MLRSVRQVAARRRSKDKRYGDFLMECLYRRSVRCWPLPFPGATLTGMVLRVLVTDKEMERSPSWTCKGKIYICCRDYRPR
jgi:hypothetical protein